MLSYIKNNIQIIQQHSLMIDNTRSLEYARSIINYYNPYQKLNFRAQVQHQLLNNMHYNKIFIGIDVAAIIYAICKRGGLAKAEQRMQQVLISLPYYSAATITYCISKLHKIPTHIINQLSKLIQVYKGQKLIQQHLLPSNHRNMNTYQLYFIQQNYNSIDQYLCLKTLAYFGCQLQKLQIRYINKYWKLRNWLFIEDELLLNNNLSIMPIVRYGTNKQIDRNSMFKVCIVGISIANIILAVKLARLGIQAKVMDYNRENIAKWANRCIPDIVKQGPYFSNPQEHKILSKLLYEYIGVQIQPLVSSTNHNDQSLYEINDIYDSSAYDPLQKHQQIFMILLEQVMRQWPVNSNKIFWNQLYTKAVAHNSNSSDFRYFAKLTNYDKIDIDELRIYNERILMLNKIKDEGSATVADLRRCLHSNNFNKMSLNNNSLSYIIKPQTLKQQIYGKLFNNGYRNESEQGQSAQGNIIKKHKQKIEKNDVYSLSKYSSLSSSQSPSSSQSSSISKPKQKQKNNNNNYQNKSDKINKIDNLFINVSNQIIKIVYNSSTAKWDVKSKQINAKNSYNSKQQSQQFNFVVYTPSSSSKYTNQCNPENSINSHIYYNPKQSQNQAQNKIQNTKQTIQPLHLSILNNYTKQTHYLYRLQDKVMFRGAQNRSDANKLTYACFSDQFAILHFYVMLDGKSIMTCVHHRHQLNNINKYKDYHTQNYYKQIQHTLQNVVLKKGTRIKPPKYTSSSSLSSSSQQQKQDNNKYNENIQISQYVTVNSQKQYESIIFQHSNKQLFVSFPMICNYRQQQNSTSMVMNNCQQSGSSVRSQLHGHLQVNRTIMHRIISEIQEIMRKQQNGNIVEQCSIDNNINNDDGQAQRVQTTQIDNKPIAINNNGINIENKQDKTANINNICINTMSNNINKPQHNDIFGINHPIIKHYKQHNRQIIHYIQHTAKKILSCNGSNTTTLDNRQAPCRMLTLSSRIFSNSNSNNITSSYPIQLACVNNKNINRQTHNHNHRVFLLQAGDACMLPTYQQRKQQLQEQQSISQDVHLINYASITIKNMHTQNNISRNSNSGDGPMIIYYYMCIQIHSLPYYCMIQQQHNNSNNKNWSQNVIKCMLFHTSYTQLCQTITKYNSSSNSNSDAYEEVHPILQTNIQIQMLYNRYQQIKQIVYKNISSLVKTNQTITILQKYKYINNICNNHNNKQLQSSTSTNMNNNVMNMYTSGSKQQISIWIYEQINRLIQHYCHIYRINIYLIQDIFQGKLNINYLILQIKYNHTSYNDNHGTSGNPYTDCLYGIKHKIGTCKYPLTITTKNSNNNNSNDKDKDTVIKRIFMVSQTVSKSMGVQERNQHTQYEYVINNNNGNGSINNIPIMSPYPYQHNKINTNNNNNNNNNNTLNNSNIGTYANTVNNKYNNHQQILRIISNILQLSYNRNKYKYYNIRQIKQQFRCLVQQQINNFITLMNAIQQQIHDSRSNANNTNNMEHTNNIYKQLYIYILMTRMRNNNKNNNMINNNSNTNILNIISNGKQIQEQYMEIFNTMVNQGDIVMYGEQFIICQ